MPEEMKKAINNEGVEIEVTQSTPTKLIDGKRYLLTQEEIDAEAQRAQAAIAEGARRKVLNNILELEAKITNRRIREAILNTDNGWLANQESLIAEERNKL